MIFHFIDKSKSNIYEGYRPAHMVKKGYLTTGLHSYYNIEDGVDEIKGRIAFISPQDYLDCLWVGKEIEMYEGSKMIGYATITRIFNPVLEK